MNWVRPSSCTSFRGWVFWQVRNWQAGNVRQYGRWVTFHRLLGFEWITGKKAQQRRKEGDWKLPSTLRAELTDMTKLCDELRLALAHQQEVNDALVEALDVVRTYHPDAGYAPWESTLQVVLAALAASREVK